jgi:hypothetical protein
MEPSCIANIEIRSISKSINQTHRDMKRLEDCDGKINPLDAIKFSQLFAIMTIYIRELRHLAQFHCKCTECEGLYNEIAKEITS